MANFFHKFFNPHCPECQAERVCQSCEILKTELARLQRENEKLLNKLMSEEVPEKIINPNPVPVLPRNIPWNVRRQMLETEDREKARLMREAPKPQSTSDLEAELGVGGET